MLIVYIYFYFLLKKIKYEQLFDSSMRCLVLFEIVKLLGGRKAEVNRAEGGTVTR